MEQLKNSSYRPDIDGLRAISVLLVVIFHAFPSIVHGGFIGVDIFFVISGFLISTILLNNLQNNNFSIKEFYYRRIKRIFPALIVVLLSCFLFGWIALLADEYQQLGKHIAAGAGFIANISFWQESGYFDSSAISKPLLHLWSLGIEEQFYIFWPLLLYFAWNQQINLTKLIVLLIAISFTANIYYINSDPSATFYLPHTRVWELLMGALLAAWSLKNNPSQNLNNYSYENSNNKANKNSNNKINYNSANKSNNILSILGLALICVSAVYLDKNDNFPGWWSLLPTLGALMIIFSGQHALINKKLLAHKSAVWLGLISFPLYLWHWPILSFIYIINGSNPSRGARLLAVIVSVILAWLTYKFIERPIRQKTMSFKVVLPLASTMVLIFSLGLLTNYNGGMKLRFANSNTDPRAFHATSAIQQDLNYENNTNYNNFFNSTPIKVRDFLIEHNKNSKYTVAILGDSHANKLFIGTQKYSNLNLVNIGRGTCPPLKGIEVYQPNGDSYKCQPLTDNYLEFVKHSKQIDLLVLNAFYNHYLKPEVTLISDGKPASLKQALKGTIDYLLESGKVVVIATDVPELSNECFLSSSRRKLPVWTNSVDYSKCTFASNVQATIDEGITAELQHVFSNKNFRIFNTSKSFCNETFCGEIDPTDHLYSNDGNHLNDYGALRAGKDFANYLNTLSQDSNLLAKK